MTECQVRIMVKRPGISKKKVTHIVCDALLALKKTGAVSVHLVGDAKMRALNNTYRGVDKPTDILSFAAQEGEWGSAEDLGDLFVSPAYVARQAKRFAVPVKEELQRILLHGLLHLLGYEHEKQKEADIMFSVQEDLLKKISDI